MIPSIWKLRVWWLTQKGRFTKEVDGVWTHDCSREAAALLDLRRKLAPDLQSFFPGVSVCGRCQWPWTLVDPHTVELGGGHGCFSLCEKCWRELYSSTYRLPYFKKDYDRYWKDDDAHQWAIIDAAICAEDRGLFSLILDESVR